VIAFLVVAYADQYQGPSPYYFELMLWPMMLIFSAFILSATSWQLLSALPSWLNWSLLRANAMTYPFLLVAIALMLAVGNTATARAYRTPACRAAGFVPLRATPIIERLRQDIALQPGTPFRGLVATFDGPLEKPGVSWFDVGWYDFVVWQ